MALSFGFALLLFAAVDAFIAPIPFTRATLYRFGGFTSFVFMFCLYVHSQKQESRVTKGTVLVTPEEFNQKVNGDGIGIPFLKTGPLHNALTKAGNPRVSYLRIRKEDEPVHLLISGDSGTGKSALHHTLLEQIANRPRERVIVYDPSLEFWKRHGNPSRGDILLHPLEQECPYWDLPGEIRTPLDATALTQSLIPDSVEGKKDFFETSPRRLLAKMLLELNKQNKGVDRLLRWLEDKEKIYDLIDGTSLETLIDKNSHGQRSGILATLTEIAEPLGLLPRQYGRPSFTFTRWCAEGSGWLFIGTKGFGERAALRPLISAWLDTAFARLMEHIDGIPTWVFVDELPSLQRLPSLKTALHEGRKYNMRFVLGFQGRAQIEQLYGKDAETLMSAPSTRIFLRSNEYAAAEWAAKNIGMPEQERDVHSYTSSLSTRGSDSMSHRVEKKSDYLIYPNEIQNLSKLTGYLRYDKFVVPISFPYPKQPNKKQ